MPEMSMPYDPHQFFETDTYSVSEYTFHDGRIEVYDAVWGPCEIGPEPGDEVLLELSRNPLVRRTMSVEQLTLDKYIETLPNAANFSRWEHLWGSVVFVRQKTENLGLDPRDRLILQLRTLVSDLGHTVYSHLGDWMFQGAGQAEDQHDQELMHLMEVSGVNDILRSHSIAPEEVVFPPTRDWIECPSPDLCVDRVDYGAREIRRWLDIHTPIHSSTSIDAFEVDDKGRLVMRSHRDALTFSKAFLLLPTEHWAEPIHRLQLSLQEQLVKRVLTSDETGLFASDMDPPDEYFPRDYMYSFDFDITWEHMRSWDSYMTVVRTLMEDIGRYSRRNFVFQRKGQLQSFFSEVTEKPDLPVPAVGYGFGMYQILPMIPPNISLAPAEKDDKFRPPRKGDTFVDIYLPPLKPRFVDPLYFDEKGKVRRLSEEDAYYKKLLAQQKKVLAQAYIARVHVNPESARLINLTKKETDEAWDEALKRPRMGKAEFKRMLGETAMLAANHRLVRIQPGEITDFSFWPG